MRSADSVRAQHPIGSRPDHPWATAKTAMEMTSLWKPENGFHRDLEISLTRDSHIPTTDPRRLAEGEMKNQPRSPAHRPGRRVRFAGSIPA